MHGPLWDRIVLELAMPSLVVSENVFKLWFKVFIGRESIET